MKVLNTAQLHGLRDEQLGLKMLFANSQFWLNWFKEREITQRGRAIAKEALMRMHQRRYRGKEVLIMLLTK